MTEEEREKLKEYIVRWKEIGEFLENLRREKIRKSFLADSLVAFDGVFKSAIYLNKPKPTSGLSNFIES